MTLLSCPFCGEPLEEIQKCIVRGQDAHMDALILLQTIFNTLSIEADIAKAKQLILDYLEVKK